MGILAAVAEIGTEEVKKAGVFSLPGLVRIKTRKKAATKAGKKEMFGKMVLIKARPAKTVVKAFPVAPSRTSSEGQLQLKHWVHVGDDTRAAMRVEWLPSSCNMCCTTRKRTTSG